MDQRRIGRHPACSAAEFEVHGVHQVEERGAADHPWWGAISSAGPHPDTRSSTRIPRREYRILTPGARAADRMIQVTITPPTRVITSGSFPAPRPAGCGAGKLPSRPQPGLYSADTLDRPVKIVPFAHYVWRTGAAVGRVATFAGDPDGRRDTELALPPGAAYALGRGSLRTMPCTPAARMSLHRHTASARHPRSVKPVPGDESSVWTLIAGGGLALRLPALAAQ